MIKQLASHGIQNYNNYEICLTGLFKISWSHRNGLIRQVLLYRLTSHHNGLINHVWLYKFYFISNADWCKMLFCVFQDVSSPESIDFSDDSMDMSPSQLEPEPSTSSSRFDTVPSLIPNRLSTDNLLSLISPPSPIGMNPGGMMTSTINKNILESLLPCITDYDVENNAPSHQLLQGGELLTALDNVNVSSGSQSSPRTISHLFTRI